MGVFMPQKISYKAMMGSQKLDAFFAAKPKSAVSADEQKEAGDKEE